MQLRCVTWAGVLLAVGCTKPTPNPTPADKDQPRKAADTPAPAPSPTPAAVPGVDPTAFAKDFLKAAHEGSATAAQLTPAFKKVIAPPVFEADQAAGYSDAAADTWLKAFQGKLTAPSVYAFGGDANAQLFTGFLPGEKPRAIALRLAKADTAWQVDWFFPAEVEPAAVPKTGDAAAFAGAAFLEALVGGNGHLAAGLVSPAAKARLAPPFSGQKQPYNAGILDTKLSSYRGNFTGFAITKAEAGGVAGELTGPGAKKPFALKLVPGERPFDWLIDDVKID